MASATSNVDQVNARLDDLADCLDFTEGGLGEDLLDLVVGGISDRSAGERAPDASQWAPNEPGYAARKGGRPVGVDTGEMLSIEQLKGTRTITKDEATMDYGVSGPARDKAGWFTEGGRAPARPFYAIDDEIEARVMAAIEAHVADVIRGLG